MISRVPFGLVIVAYMVGRLTIDLAIGWWSFWTGIREDLRNGALV